MVSFLGAYKKKKWAEKLLNQLKKGEFSKTTKQLRETLGNSFTDILKDTGSLLNKTASILDTGLLAFDKESNLRKLGSFGSKGLRLLSKGADYSSRFGKFIAGK